MGREDEGNDGEKYCFLKNILCFCRKFKKFSISKDDKDKKIKIQRSPPYC